MRASRIMRWAAVAAVLTAHALHAQGAPPAQTAAAPAAAPAPPPSACGNTAYCTETNDFAAVITDFRTSDFRGYKMIDVVMHFVNKTPKPLVLGYVQNSGTIIDDKGNRYVVWGANGVRGIGQVYGGTFDPKFTLDGGGSGDAQFELAWYPGQQIYGFTFAFDLAIDEINSYEGGQHSLGGEFPLHFQGLANGISSGGQVAMGAGAAGGAAGGMGGAGGGAAGGQPCNSGGAAGTAAAVANATGSQAVQGAAAQGASTVAQATTAVQSLASIFGKKKSQPNKPAASPCGSASGTVTQSAAGSVATPAPSRASSTTPATATRATTPAKAATTSSPVAMKAGGVRPGTTPPVTQPTTKTAPPPTTTATRNPAPKNGPKKTVTSDTTKHP